MPPGTRRTLWLAIAISLAIHFALLSGLSGTLFPPVDVAPTMTAELQRIEPPPPPPQKPRPKPPIASKPPAPVRQAAPRAVKRPPPPRRIVVPEDPDSLPIQQAQPDVDAPATPDLVPDPRPVPGPPPEPDPTPREPTQAQTAPAALPARGSIHFDVLFGGGVIGRSTQRWHFEGTTYRLSSFSETTGLLGLFLPYLYAYVSEGTIGPEGLRPREFTSRRGRGGSRQSTAVFDWQQGEIALGPLGSPRTQRLPGGTQDLLSFIYELARGPIEPGERMMVITSGHKLDTYVLDIGAEELIELPIGTVRTIPIRQVSAPGEEHVQVWLAADPPRLPVRLRFFDREGRPTIEQVATRIDTHDS